MAQQGQRFCPPLAIEFLDLLAPMATVIIAQAPAINKQAVIACCYSGRPKTTLDGCKAASWSARKKVGAPSVSALDRHRKNVA